MTFKISSSTTLLLSLILLAFSCTLTAAKTEQGNTDSKHKVKSGCYTKWNHLRDDLEGSTGRETFVICPGATLYPDTYLQEGDDFSDAEINGPQISILCGNSGSYDNKCTISGGLSHFSIGENAGAGILISGIKFEKATDTSINAFGPRHSHMTIRDCVFEQNSAEDAGAILIWYDDSSNSNAMNVVIESSSFVNNKGDDAIVLNQGGYLSVTNSFFSGSQDSWTLVVTQGGSLVLDSSCFQDNYGPVYLYADSYLIKNNNVFGQNTENDPQYICTGAVIQGADEACSKFDSPQCLARPLSSISDSGSSDTATYVTVSLVFVALGMGVGFFVLKRKGLQVFGRHKKYHDEDETDSMNRTHEGEQSGSLRFTEENDDGEVVRPIYV